MRAVTFAFAVSIAVVALPASAQSSSQDSNGAPSMKCDTGPLLKIFGGSKWFIYSCPDGKTPVIYSAPGSPAEPFYFMFFPTDGGYRLYGEGTGEKAATEAAMKELQSLTRENVASLIEETKSAKK